MSLELPSAFTEAERQALAFAEEVGGLAVGIVGAAIAEVVFEREADPKLYGLALLCRLISNFQGALTMARLDQAVSSGCGPLLFREPVSGRPTFETRTGICEDLAKPRRGQLDFA